MDRLRVVVVVSADRSDLYFANQLLQRVNVVGVIVENQLEKPDNSPLLAKVLRLLPRPDKLIARIYGAISDRWREKFAPYNQPENKADFGEEGRRLLADRNCATRFTSGVNDINAPDNVAWLRDLRPDLVAVCGASIFRDEIIAIPRKGVLNLHGGLSQRYRGLFTTDWAIYNEEPEYVGATVHYVAPGIDDGDVIYQGRPNIEAGDNPNSLYVKVVKLGVDMMERAIRDIEEQCVRPRALKQKGDLYLGRMFTPAKRDATWRKLRKGIIAAYLADKQRRDAPVLGSMLNDFRGAPPVRVESS